MPEPITHDEKWMRLALELAAKGLGHTAPNPMVGAVIVRGDTLVSGGWHRGPGQAHAEVDAFDKAPPEVQGATLYVTLEPCCHWGRTGPCTLRILQSGITRIVAAVQDPNPIVNGKGFAQLREAGIQVDVGLLAHEAMDLNRGYFTWVSLGRPYVHAKVAQSLDGKVATRTGESQWITSEASRADGHGLRAAVDAIIVGVGTVLSDDPQLTARPPGTTMTRQPLRVVLDSVCRTPLRSKCLQLESKTLIATTRHAPESSKKALLDAGAEVWVDPSGSKQVEPEALLRALGARGATTVLVEGGPRVVGSFAQAGLIDEVHAYIAPLIIGGDRAPSSVQGTGADRISNALRFAVGTWAPLGQDMKFNGRVQRAHLVPEKG